MGYIVRKKYSLSSHFRLIKSISCLSSFRLKAFIAALKIQLFEQTANIELERLDLNTQSA